MVQGFQAGFVVDGTPVPGTADKVFLTDFVAGRVSILDRTTGTVTPFLDGVVIDGIPIGAKFFESAAFALAPAPDFETSGRFYVSVNTSVDQPGGGTATQNVVVEYTADPVGLTVDPTTQRRILTLDHPPIQGGEIHYGGALRFGPDGMLYLTTGDIGADFGPGSDNPAQDEDSLLGGVLRIDPSADAFPGDPLNNYAVPAGNPDFGGGPSELIASGLRNPFKADFDPETGVMYIGEVGQTQRDEIDVIGAGPLQPLNFGWPAFEGTLPLTPGYTIDGILTAPIYELSQGFGPFDGFSVTGGTVYRGPLSRLDGLYFFSDFGTGDPGYAAPVWSFRYDPLGGTVSELRRWHLQVDGGGTLGPALGFATDGDGNMYVSDANGTVYLFEAAVVPLPAAGLLLAGGLGAVAALRRRRRLVSAARAA